MAVANTISNIFSGIIKDKMTIIVEEEELISGEQNGFRNKNKNKNKNRRGQKSNYTACSQTQKKHMTQ